jgi:hypothetical protein
VLSEAGRGTTPAGAREPPENPRLIRSAGTNRREPGPTIP